MHFCRRSTTLFPQEIVKYHIMKGKENILQLDTTNIALHYVAVSVFPYRKQNGKANVVPSLQIYFGKK